VYPHAGTIERGEDAARRVSVGVLGADGHQGDPCAAGGHELRIGVTAAVVRHLEHICAEVDTGRHQPCLGLRTQVSRQEHAEAPRGDTHDQRQVVGFRRPRGPLRRRREDIDGDSSHRPRVPRLEGDPLRPRPADQGLEPSYPLVGRRQGAGGHDADVPPGERPGEAGRVVGVEMGDQDQGQCVDPEAVEAAVDGTGIRACVDQHRLSRTRRHHQGVPLADVARDDHRLRRWPAAHGLPERPPEYDEAEQGSQRQRAQRREPPQRPGSGEQHESQQDGATGPGGPARRPVRNLGGPLGDPDEPADRPAGQPHEPVAEHRGQRTDDGRRQAEHGGRRHRGSREKVRGQRDEADGSGQPGHDRCGGQPCCGADGHGVGQEGTAAALSELE
jgi:hypothetical protein